MIGRDDLAGFVVDRTAAVHCATTANKTTVLHITAMSKNIRVMEELVATAERQHKLQKIINQPNARGDTALMMACVAKNVKAVQHLLQLGAIMDLVNASGLNALMCAACIGQDPRSSALSNAERMHYSAEIITVLLANGANANAVEKREGNTALHLAALRENVDAVECLIQKAENLDITVRNKVKKTALDLSMQMSGVAAVQIQTLLNDKNTEAAQQSAKIERELLDFTAVHYENNLNQKQMHRMEKKKTKTTKKRRPDAQKIAQDMATKWIPTQDKLELNEFTKMNEVIASSSCIRDTTSIGTALPGPVVEISKCGIDNDTGDWLKVVFKKSWRKDLGSRNVKAKSKEKPHDGMTDNPKKVMRTTRTVLESVPSQACFERSKARVPASVVPKSPDRTKESNAIATGFLASQVLSEDDEYKTSTSTIPHDGLNEFFHRTFPVAVELEINVEKFFIASSMSDRELDPNNSLSISQVEALQEAHWQAYHYLNEKKIELTRTLEVQRVEARFALQQELMQMK